MEPKKILGLDLGTNSIGAALINIPKSFEDYGKEGNIEWIGSRIIPVDGEYLQKFESGGQGKTKAAARREKRGSRRLKQRYILRRSRLIKVFKILGWVDESFPENFKKKMANEESFKFHISNYLPFETNTMEEATQLLGVKNKKGELAVSEDWIIYYLRKKALTEKVSFSELARIIYMLNQRRGFKSSRKDLRETVIMNYDEFIKRKKEIDNGVFPEYKKGKGEECKTQFVSITKIKSVTQVSEEKDKNGKFAFKIEVEDNRVFSWEVKRFKKPEWENIEEQKLVVEQKINKKGEIKQDSDPKIPKADDWDLLMTALDNQINEKYYSVSQLQPDGSYKEILINSPGAFFFDKLVENKNYKIRQITVRREKYKKELETIWKKQLELNEGLRRLNTDKNLIQKISETLYPTQTKAGLSKSKEIIANDLLHVISDDIIYYQRELKSQKNSIGECQYEKHKGIDGEYYGVKCAPKSSPEFQEFRIWQDIHNIRVFEKEVKETNNAGEVFTKIDVDRNKQFIDLSVKEKLFELFDSSKEISEENVFELLNEYHQTNLSKETHRVNLFANREKLLGNETKDVFRKIFRKNNYESKGEKLLANKEIFKKLWHINYSISSSDLKKSEKGIMTALGWNKEDSKEYKTEGEKNSNWDIFKLPKEVVLTIAKLPEPSQKKYASYSSKAINKLLPLMRCRRYWNADSIHPQTKERIEKIIKDGWDFSYDKKTGELIKEREFKRTEQFADLPVWMACYVAYNRHSERESDKKYNEDELKNLNIMQLIPNNSLRNPIVEQVVRETMFLVKDICKEFGQPDEIHIELGRELKKNAAEKERISKNNSKNFEEKKRIKKLLSELMNGGFEHYDEEGEKVNYNFSVNPNPESPADIDKFRVYKSCGQFDFIPDKKKNEDEVKLDELFKDGKKEKVPTNAEVKKYALWLSQKCMSPYTGKIIPLSKLFDKTEYEVEHVIPQSKLKNDAFDNLVVAEAAINPPPYKGNLLGRNFISQFGGRVLTIHERKYKILTGSEYETHCKNTFKGKKLKNLLATEVPDDFISRQINDTRYITRKISELLYPVAKEKEGLIFTIGSITSDLKKEWGLNDVWKKLLLPRFERLETIIGSQHIIHDKDDFGNPVIHLRVKENEEFDSKRIDHRHHAMDALIIAATTREHIRYLNSLNAVDTDEELKNVKRALVKGKIRDYKLPWGDFTKEAKERLEETIVTIKSNNKVVSKPSNKYFKWEQKADGTWEKTDKHFQKENKKWLAVRKSMFKEPQGIIYLKEKREVSVFDAFKIQIERMKVEYDKEKRKTASYVYDQTARPFIKDIIYKTGIDLNDTDELLKEIEKYLKKNFKKIETEKLDKNGKTISKTIYLLDGVEYEKIQIAEFVKYKAKRVKIDSTFDHKKINKIPYGENIQVNQNKKLSIPQILHKHLSKYESYLEKKKIVDERIKELKKEFENLSDEKIIKEKLNNEERSIIENPMPEAFSGEGLESLDKKIGMPIRTVTMIDGDVKAKHEENIIGKKYVENDSISKYIIYENQKTKDRTERFSISTYKALKELLDGKPIVQNKKGLSTIILSPNDLVYVPTDEEWNELKSGNEKSIDWNNKKAISKRIYKMVSVDDSFFIQHHISKAIIPTVTGEKDKSKNTAGEIDWHNKSTKTMDGKINIAERCIKIEVDRLGNVKPAS